MTDMLERAWQRHAEPSDPDCPATRAHRTNSAWLKHGCRCPEAVAEHEAWLIRKQWTGECRATEHGTLEAWHRKGCRCDDAVAARKAEIDARRAAKPRVEADPVVVGFLVAGYPIVGRPTRQDYREAVHRLTEQGKSAEDIAVWLGYSNREVCRLRRERRQGVTPHGDTRCA